MRQAHRVVGACSHRVRVIRLIYILHLRSLTDATSEHGTVLLVIVALISETKNLFVSQEWELSQFADFGHLRRICELVPHGVEALPDTHDVLQTDACLVVDVRLEIK